MELAIELRSAVPDTGRAVRPVPLDLEVPPGAFCLVEAAAASCAAVVRLCAGLIPPVEGRVAVLGVEPARLRRAARFRLRQRLGIGLQPGGLVSNLNLRMNLLVVLLYGGVGLAEAEQRVAETLGAFGLEEWASLRPADTPSDVCEAAALARAAVRRPELLILESPAVQLRTQHAEYLLALCREYARTVLVTATQQHPFLLGLADSAICWDDQAVTRRIL